MESKAPAPTGNGPTVVPTTYASAVPSTIRVHAAAVTASTATGNPVAYAIAVPTAMPVVSGAPAPFSSAHASSAGHVVASNLAGVTTTGPTRHVIVNAVPTSSSAVSVKNAVAPVRAQPAFGPLASTAQGEVSRTQALGLMANLHESIIVRGIAEYLDANGLLALGSCSSFLFDLTNEAKLWHDLVLIKFRGKQFRFHHSWKLSMLCQHTDGCKRAKLLSEDHPVLSARHGIESQFLQQTNYFRSVDLSRFVVEPEPDPRFTVLRPSEWQAMSCLGFAERFTRQFQPVLKQGMCKEWPAFEKWSIDALAERFPTVRFKISRRHVEADHTGLRLRPAAGRVRMTLKEYAEYQATTTDIDPLYIFDENFGERAPELLNDYNVGTLKFFPEDLLSVLTTDGHNRTAPQMKDADNGKGKDGTTRNHTSSTHQRPDYRWLVIGPQKSGASWHTDPIGTSAWNALLRGRKRWAMYPPSHPPPGHDEDGKSLTSMQWYFSVYPNLEVQDRPLEIVQEPGDVVFIPSGWWHMVLNLEETVSVTQNFADSFNLQHVCVELARTDSNAAHVFLDKLLQFDHADSRYAHRIRSLARLFSVPRWTGFQFHGEYIQSFSDTELWHLPVTAICNRHNIPAPLPNYLPCADGFSGRTRLVSLVPPGHGTNPVFCVGKYVVKLFSHFSAQEWPVVVPGAARPASSRPDTAVDVRDREFAALQAAALDEVLAHRTPKAVAQGILTLPYECAGPEHGSYRWPYIVVELCYGQTLRTIDDEDWMGLQPNHVVWPHVARWLGHTLRTVHSLPSSVALSQNSAQSHAGAGSNCYTRFLGDLRRTCISRHLRHWNIPDHLWLQMGQFLPSEDAIRSGSALVPSKGDVTLLHGDITKDNIMMCSVPQPKEDIDDDIPTWRCRSLIDFADLHIFLQAYGLDWRPVWTFEAMCLAILHPSKRCLFSIFQHCPECLEMQSWEEIANHVFPAAYLAPTPSVAASSSYELHR